MRRRPPTGAVRLAILIALATVIPALGGSIAFAQGRDFGRSTIRVPDPTTAGSWSGSWVFENRLRQVALWIREGADGPQIRLKHLALTNAETFATEWDGTATYSYGGVEGEVRIAIDEGDSERAVGSWFWRTTNSTRSLTERGRFTMFRAEDGRYAVVRFDELEIERDSGESVTRTTPPRVWIFRQASRRLVGWDELAF